MQFDPAGHEGYEEGQEGRSSTSTGNEGHEGHEVKWLVCKRRLSQVTLEADEGR